MFKCRLHLICRWHVEQVIVEETDIGFALSVLSFSFSYSLFFIMNCSPATLINHVQPVHRTSKLMHDLNDICCTFFRKYFMEYE